MAELWIAHDRVARDLLAEHGGVEADRTDGFLLLFGDVAGAVAFASRFHAEIGRLGERFGVPFAARVGVHWGPVILIETPAADRARGAKPLEVEGLAKPYAARVASLAGPRQTLLSADARARLPDAVDVVSHGFWRMKGVDEPAELFEARHDVAPLAPPADAAKVYRVVRDGDGWRPARDVPSSLPRERDAFVGRASDLQAIARRFDDGAALVTLVGIGGTGKTRVATRYAWAWLGDWPGGAWFCDLSDARDVEGIVHAVARVLDVPLGQGDPVRQLGHAIASRGACLVVLDNFEQVARHAADVLGPWLDRAHDARFLVTSREILGLPGEEIVALAPLPTSDAADLFVRRAAVAKPGYAPSAEEAKDVQALVSLLDGLPLAVELAAARVKVMPPKALLARMGERFKLLTSTGGRRDRQATLRATLDWSWDLLSDGEKATLAQLSVFEGGFTLDAAEAVVSLADGWVVDVVQSLVDRSWVRPLDGDRFDLLVSVQQYAGERLAAVPQSDRDAAATTRRHGQWFARSAETSSADLGNVAAACRRAAVRGDGELAADALDRAWEQLEQQGPMTYAIELADVVLAVPELPRGPRVRASCVAASARAVVGRLIEAERLADDARALVDGDPALAALVDRTRAVIAFDRGDLAAARPGFERALEGAQELGDVAVQAAVHRSLGNVASAENRYEQAVAHFDESIALSREAGDARGEARTQSALGRTLGRLGRWDAALAAYGAAIEALTAVGDRRGLAAALQGRGVEHIAVGRTDAALHDLERALAIARDFGDGRAQVSALATIGNVHLHHSRYDEAMASYDAAIAALPDAGNRVLEPVLLGCRANVHLMQGRPDAARRDYEAALALNEARGHRVGCGFNAAGLGRLAYARGDLAEAGRWFDRAFAAVDATGDAELEYHLLHTGMLVLGKLGRGAEARDRLAALARRASSTGNDLLVGIAVVTRAEVALAEGDFADARASLDEAEGIARRLGLGPEAELVRELAAYRAQLDAASAG